MELNIKLMSLIMLFNLIIFILIFLYAEKEAERKSTWKNKFQK